MVWSRERRQRGHVRQLRPVGGRGRSAARGAPCAAGAVRSGPACTSRGAAVRTAAPAVRTTAATIFRTVAPAVCTAAAVRCAAAAVRRPTAVRAAVRPASAGAQERARQRHPGDDPVLLAARRRCHLLRRVGGQAVGVRRLPGSARCREEVQPVLHARRGPRTHHRLRVRDRHVRSAERRHLFVLSPWPRISLGRRQAAARRLAPCCSSACSWAVWRPFSSPKSVGSCRRAASAHSPACTALAAARREPWPRSFGAICSPRFA